MSDERAEELANRLWLVSRRSGRTGWDGVAKGILDDPQAHIDALMEAGVLEAGTYDGSYRVVHPKPPHVHEWAVTAAVSTRKTLTLVCRAEDAGPLHHRKAVPNRLPIEVPE